MMRKWFEIAPGIIQWLAVLLFFANPPKQNPFYPKDKSAKKTKQILFLLNKCERQNYYI